jgi:hypothetical protein
MINGLFIMIFIKSIFSSLIINSILNNDSTYSLNYDISSYYASYYYIHISNLITTHLFYPTYYFVTDPTTVLIMFIDLLVIMHKMDRI